MADPLSITASVAGILSLLVQITCGIDKLQDIRKRIKTASAELDCLLRQLDFLVYIMQQVNSTTPREDFAFQHCQQSCAQVNQNLEKLIQTVEQHPKGGRRQVLRYWAFRHWKQDIEALHVSIQAAKTNLILCVYIESPRNCLMLSL